MDRGRRPWFSWARRDGRSRSGPAATISGRPPSSLHSAHRDPHRVHRQHLPLADGRGARCAAALADRGIDAARRARPGCCDDGQPATDSGRRDHGDPGPRHRRPPQPADHRPSCWPGRPDRRHGPRARARGGRAPPRLLPPAPSRSRSWSAGAERRRAPSPGRADRRLADRAAHEGRAHRAALAIADPTTSPTRSARAPPVYERDRPGAGDLRPAGRPTLASGRSTTGLIGDHRSYRQPCRRCTDPSGRVGPARPPALTTRSEERSHALAHRT